MNMINDMNIKSFLGGALTGLVLAGAIVGIVSALPVSDLAGLTEERAIEIALREIPGEVLEIERGEYHGVPIFEIEILDAGGAEMEIKIAAETGKIMQVESEGLDCDLG